MICYQDNKRKRVVHSILSKTCMFSNLNQVGLVPWVWYLDITEQLVKHTFVEIV